MPRICPLQRPSEKPLDESHQLARSTTKTWSSHPPSKRSASFPEGGISEYAAVALRLLQSRAWGTIQELAHGRRGGSHLEQQIDPRRHPRESSDLRFDSDAAA